MKFDNLQDLIDAWDANQTVSTVEMGGIGPGYEQAIQVGIFETCREFLDPVRRDQLQRFHEQEETLDAPMDIALNRAIERHGGFLNELSGAQAGAIKSVAAKYVLFGHRASLDQAEEQGIEPDRFILVSRRFPGQEEQANG